MMGNRKLRFMTFLVLFFFGPYVKYSADKLMALCCISWFADFSETAAAFTVELRTEKYVVVNESVILHCNYNIPPKFVHKVEWHRATSKVAEYILKGEVPYKYSYNPVAGAVVDDSFGGPTMTVLRNTDLDASGNYSCSVTMDPNLTTIQSTEKEITIVIPQTDEPELMSSSNYDVGDLLYAECQSAPAHPAPFITFLINNKPVPKRFVDSHVTKHPISRRIDLYSCRAKFSIKVPIPDIQFGCSLYLRCISSLPEFLGSDFLPEQYADYKIDEMTVNVSDPHGLLNYSSKADKGEMSSAGLLLVTILTLVWGIMF